MLKNTLGHILLITISLLMSSMVVYSEESTSENVDLNYPELMMSPRATERLAIESNREARTHWYSRNVPTLLSATTTFIAGIVQFGKYDASKDPDKRSPLVGLSVGGGWLLVNLYVYKYYGGYIEGFEEIKKLPAKTTHQQLVRERLAEEHINKLGAINTRLKWLSIVTNLGTNIYMLSNAQNKSTASVASSIAIAASFGPLIFSSEWERVASEQRKYQKKIYRPIITSTLFQDNSGNIVPGAMVSLHF